jgi:hypothetical protein
MFGGELRGLLWYLGVWRKEYRPSDIVGGKGRSERGSNANSIEQRRSGSVVVQPMRLIEHGGASSASVPRSPLSVDVSQRCSSLLF